MPHAHQRHYGPTSSTSEKSMKKNHATHILDAENPIVAQSEGVIKSAGFIGIVDSLAPP